MFQGQIYLKSKINSFNEYTKPKNLSKKEDKVLTLENANRLLKERQKVLNRFKKQNNSY